MAVKYFLLFLVCLAATSYVHCSNMGSSFYGGFFTKDLRMCQNLTADIVSEQANTMFYTIGANVTGIVMKASIEGNILIPCLSNQPHLNQSHAKDSLSFEGIHKSSVVLSSYSTHSGEAALLFPEEHLGREYTVASYEPTNPDSQSYITVYSKLDNTLVTIYDREYKESTNYTLNNRESLKYVSERDITGYHVISSQPVSVISGTLCASVPANNTNNCDMLMESMIPTNVWDTTYIVPPVLPVKHYEVKILTDCNFNNLAVCMKTKSSLNCVSKDIASQKFTFGEEATVVTSFSPVGVVQYGTGTANLTNQEGDTFMTAIPGLKNYLNKYTFVIPEVYNEFQNYATIIIEQSKISGLKLDGKTPSVFNYTYDVPPPLANYIVLVTELPPGRHVFAHDDKDTKFGLLIYGLKKPDGKTLVAFYLYGLKIDISVGYGYPAGLDLTPIDTINKRKCGVKVDSVATTVPETTSTTTLKPTTTPTTTTKPTTTSTTTPKPTTTPTTTPKPTTTPSTTPKPTTTPTTTPKPTTTPSTTPKPTTTPTTTPKPTTAPTTTPKPTTTPTTTPKPTTTPSTTPKPTTTPTTTPKPTTTPTTTPKPTTTPTTTPKPPTTPITTPIPTTPPATTPKPTTTPTSPPKPTTTSTTTPKPTTTPTTTSKPTTTPTTTPKPTTTPTTTSKPTTTSTTTPKPTTTPTTTSKPTTTSTTTPKPTTTPTTTPKPTMTSSTTLKPTTTPTTTPKPTTAPTTTPKPTTTTTTTPKPTTTPTTTPKPTTTPTTTPKPTTTPTTTPKPTTTPTTTPKPTTTPTTTPMPTTPPTTTPKPTTTPTTTPKPTTTTTTTPKPTTTPTTTPKPTTPPTTTPKPTTTPTTTPKPTTTPTTTPKPTTTLFTTPKPTTTTTTTPKPTTTPTTTSKPTTTPTTTPKPTTTSTTTQATTTQQVLSLIGPDTQHITVPVNSSVSLNCSITETISTKITWAKLHGCLPPFSGSVLPLTQHATLGDAGTYQCDVTDNSGVSLTKIFYVDVASTGMDLMCNFEQSTICEWVQDSGDDFDWAFQNGPTQSSSTGPENDHTLGNEQGVYLFIETSAPRFPGEIARILSPMLPANTGLCLKFWYYLFGDGIGNLQVFIQDECTKTMREVFKVSGDKGEQWYESIVDITSSDDYRIIIQADVGPTYHGDIAIDDITISKAACRNSGQNTALIG